jgi:hypothetical protein
MNKNLLFMESLNYCGLEKSVYNVQHRIHGINFRKI